jgi:hypothetical protein
VSVDQIQSVLSDGCVCLSLLLQQGQPVHLLILFILAGAWLFVRVLLLRSSFLLFGGGGGLFGSGFGSGSGRGEDYLIDENLAVADIG